MNQYLIDTCVLLGWANTKDKHHKVCKKFFENHKKEELFFSIHSLFEFKGSKSRRIKGKDFDGLPGTYRLENKKFVDIDRKFYDYCQNNGIFEKFQLKGGDLIFACIAKVGEYTLVTCDSDFDNYQNEIKLLKLT
jgi:PIN domain nuclease of toxin-antitoxin system